MEASAARAIPSSARGSKFRLNPLVETRAGGSTPAAMTRPRVAPTVPVVNLRELPPLRASGRPGGPPVALRVVGFLSLAVIVISVLTVDPMPGVSGAGPLVALGLVLLCAGIAGSLPQRELPNGRRFVALIVGAAGACLLTAVQPHSAGFAGIYYVVVIAGMRLPGRLGLAVAGGTLGAECAVMALTGGDDAAGAIVGLLFSVIPWFLVMRLVRRLIERGREAEDLVEELRESRAAHAESVAIAERSRVARDMHDVLAHSLSALALQLEGARLLARDRGSDPEVVASIERAHHLAAGGLAEARQAIAALRGDELPGPERLAALADAVGEHSDATCTLDVTGEPRALAAGSGERSYATCPLDFAGEPRALASEARLAIYRTAQEALTNVRRHSA